MPEPYLWPSNVSNVAYNPWTDLRWRQDVAELRLKFPWEKIPGTYLPIYCIYSIRSYVCIYTFLHTFSFKSIFLEKFGKLIIQSYYAAVSYIDNMIGKLLYQLHDSMIRENTVVILTSDHGTRLIDKVHTDTHSHTHSLCN